MLASIPASMVNQKYTDLGIPNRFNLTPSRFRLVSTRSIFADGFAPVSLGFFRVAPHGVGFGENPDRPAFAVGSTTASESASAASNTAMASWIFIDRMQHDLAMMQDADQAARRHRYQARAPRRPPPARHSARRHRPRRPASSTPAEISPGTPRSRYRLDRGDIGPHQAPDREIADPADIGGAADGLAAQMQAPGREG